MDIKEVPQEKLDRDFAAAQEVIVKAQAVQAQIAQERRRRRGALALAAKRAELAALEKSLEEPVDG